MPALASAIETLRLPPAGLGLDAGCGIGSQTELLLQATSPGGRVTGLDSSAEHLAVAEESAREKGLSDLVHFQLGDVGSLPFDPGSFDWVWSADCVGFIPGDPIEMLRGLTRVVKPGGTVALILWSSQLLLPGYPFLEARLNATRAGAAPASTDCPPQRHFLRSIGWFSQVGLQEPAARTFLVDLHAPLDEGEKEALASIIEMRWGQPESELSKADWELYRQLTDRESPDSVVDREDYFGFFTYSMFWGIVPR
jgi:demethylmenaquinone methyltransferase/2-methoxy-6-polyprenyl-1,4-benzoquinol methylase